MRYVKKRIFKCWVKKKAYLLVGAENEAEAEMMIKEHMDYDVIVTEPVGLDCAQILFNDSEAKNVPERMKQEISNEEKKSVFLYDD